MLTLAHTSGLDVSASLEQGFLHPITGYDHLVAMVAIGLLSGVVGGRAIFTVPACFVGFLVIGGVFGFAAVELVGVELWIVGSLLILGLVLAGGARPRPALMYAGVALFGFAHGNAHGLELPLASSALGYALGFSLASIACHVSGILMSLAATRNPWAVRGLGLLTAGVAVYLVPSVVPVS